jgi:hypothetical protein
VTSVSALLFSITEYCAACIANKTANACIDTSFASSFCSGVHTCPDKCVVAFVCLSIVLVVPCCQMLATPKILFVFTAVHLVPILLSAHRFSAVSVAVPACCQVCACPLSYTASLKTTSRSATPIEYDNACQLWGSWFKVLLPVSSGRVACLLRRLPGIVRSFVPLPRIPTFLGTALTSIGHTLYVFCDDRSVFHEFSLIPLGCADVFERA